MRVIIIFINLCLIMVFEVNAQIKKSKSIFGIEFGFPIAKINPVNNPDNPLIQGSDPLVGGLGFSGGVFAEFMGVRKKTDGRYGPGGGIKLRFQYSQQYIENGKFLNGETFTFNYIFASLVYKICIGSGEVDIPPSKDSDTYRARKLTPNVWELEVQEGRTHPGYRTTRSFFLYIGPQTGSLQSLAYESDNSNYESSFKSVRPNVKKTDIALVGGAEIWVGRIYLDLSYQRGIQSIYTGSNVYLNAFVFKFGIGF